MRLASGLTMLVVRTLPGRLRGRYREEWLADLERAEEAGLSPGSVVLGALSFAVHLDRDDVAITGVPAAEATRRRARWAAAFGLGALILAFGGFRSTLDGSAPRLADGALGTASMLVFVLIGGLAALGLVSGIAAVRIGLPVHGGKRIAQVVLTGGILALTFTAVAVLPFAGTLTTFAVLAVGLLRMASGPFESDVARAFPVRARVGLGAAFTAFVVVVVAVGVLHILVWNPLAKLPGLSLGEIHAGIVAAGEPSGVVMVAGWAALLLAAAIAFPIWCGLERFGGSRPTRHLVVAGTLLVAAAGLTQRFAGFMTGLAVADAFNVSGGDVALSALILNVVSMLALVVAVGAALVPARWRDIEPARSAGF